MQSKPSKPKYFHLSGQLIQNTNSVHKFLSDSHIHYEQVCRMKQLNKDNTT